MRSVRMLLVLGVVSLPFGVVACGGEGDNAAGTAAERIQLRHEPGPLPVKDDRTCAAGICPPRRTVDPSPGQSVTSSTPAGMQHSTSRQ